RAGAAGGPDALRRDAAQPRTDGEAASRVPSAVRDRAPEIPWRLVIGTRNRLAHGYLGIEPETIWLIATDGVPRLRDQLMALLAAST
ncbi:MAG: DUF86 domain-containing protein, partial [Burkholderiales bacterium]|nr:DUF86 domain-containing protein [Burkholderiales bacterium]